MTPPLTQVPATLPGVVRRGTSLVAIDAADVPGHLRGRRFTPHSVDEWGIAWFSCLDGSSEGAPLSWFAVDLADVTGRAHGLRAILISEGYPEPLHEECTFREVGDGWAIYRGGDWLCGWLLDYGLFDGISRDDDRCLPDGSLWRRAEALARVLLHVLGGAS